MSAEIQLMLALQRNARLVVALEKIRDETTHIHSADGEWEAYVFDFRARGVAREALERETAG